MRDRVLKGYRPSPKPLSKKSIKLGMRVTCRVGTFAYYSGYAGNPECRFEPGDVGVVGALDVPCVNYGFMRVGGTETFVCVDFEKCGRTWRTSLHYNNLVIPE